MQPGRDELRVPMKQGRRLILSSRGDLAVKDEEVILPRDSVAILS